MGAHDELCAAPSTLLVMIDEMLLSLGGRNFIPVTDVEDMLLDIRLTADRLESEPWW